MRPTVLLSPGDRLTETQTLRLTESVALLRAKKAALDAGASRDELDTNRWVVEVHPLDTELAAPPCSEDAERRSRVGPCGYQRC